MTNYCFTLSYNLVSEIAKTTDLLYKQNDPATFKHLIVDLGFPLVRGDEVPDDITAAKMQNTEQLKALAKTFGSEYVKMPNIGVSQNWTQVYKYLKPDPDSILIGTDPDEHPTTDHWVKAMGEVMREGGYSLCSLMMIDHVGIIEQMPYREKTIAGHRVYILPHRTLNWALIGLKGEFLDKIKAVPYMKEAPIYGWIERAMYQYLDDLGAKWCILSDYLVNHTDYTNGSPGSSPLLRAWKNQLVFEIKTKPQVSFDQYLMDLKKRK